MFKHYRNLWIVGLLIVLGLGVRLWRLPADLQIHFDQGLHALATWNIWHDGDFTLLGHQTDTDGIFHGPLYYWFMTPAYMLGGGDPAAASIFQVVLDGLGVVFLFALASKLFNPKVGILSVVLYSVSYGLISYSRWLSNITPCFPLSIMFAWFAYLVYVGETKYLPLAALFVSLVTQMDGALGVFLYPVLAWVTFHKSNWPKLNLKILLIAFVAAVIPHLPLLSFEARHDFVVTRAVLRLSGSGHQGLGFSMPVIMGNLRVLFVELTHIFSYPITWLSGLFIFITLGMSIWKKHPAQTFLLTYITIFIAALSLYQRGAVLFFFVPIFALITILVSKALLDLPKVLFWLVLITILSLNIYQWKNFLASSHALTPIGTFNLITNQDRKNVVDRIYQSAAGKPFAVWIYTIPYYLDDPWLYYFAWYGQKKYGYQPIRTGGFSPRDLPVDTLFYNIYEPDDNQPTRLDSWLTEVEINFGRVDFKYTSNDGIVEHRILP